jgi:hypothetical protein
MTRFLVVVLLVSGATPAYADAVGPPPPSCPAGGEPASCHGAEYCAVDGCLGAGDCRAGETCVAREICVGSVECYWSGPTAAVVGDDCRACPAGARCESQFVCVPGPMRMDAGLRDAGRPDAPGDAGTDRRHVRYCGCAVPGRQPLEAPLELAACLFGLIAIGRRMGRCVHRSRSRCV